MGFLLPLLVVSGFWAVVGILLPVLVQFCMHNSPHRGLIQTMLVLTAVCCYIFYFRVSRSKNLENFRNSFERKLVVYFLVSVEPSVWTSIEWKCH